MTEREIILSCCGEDEYGDTRSTVAVKLSKINLNEGSEDILDEMLFDNPIVNVLRNPRFTMVDLTFLSTEDFEFVNLAARLQDFSKAENTAENEECTIGPTIVVTIIPKETKGEYYCSGMHGVWCLMPSKVGVPIDTVRFIFDNELFQAFHNDFDSVDIHEIEENLWREEEFIDE